MSPRNTSADPHSPEEIRVTQSRVACDGGGGVLGHPLVYLEMGEDKTVECGYCDRRFRLVTRTSDGGYEDPSARAPEHH
ncbi:MAG: zinc-finger domain-containing protein [Brevundimonas sp.]|nr:MAG: zinc-finger domain-containing protein [Brevundimonas sp.]